MKRLLILFMVIAPFQASFGQELSDYDKVKAAERVKQVLKDFESAFGLLLNPYLSDPDERADARNRMWASVKKDARFENDLIPNNLGTQTIDFDEYQKVAFVGYKQGGLTYHVDWEAFEFRPADNGYLVLFYGSKSLFGQYQNQKQLRIEEAPCRAGVFIRVSNHSVTEAKIGFMDTQVGEKGKQVFSLADKKNPLEFITLPEVIDKLSIQVSKSIPEGVVRKISIEEITYNGLGVSNDFSKQLTGTLKSSLTRLNHDIEIAVAQTRGFEPYMVLRGGYQKAGNFLRINVQLYNHLNQAVGKEMMSEILLLNIPNTDIEPSEHLLAEATRLRDITLYGTGKQGDVALEVATDKGFGPQSYREGDIMTLRVRVSKPCRVRLIYKDAAKNLVRLRNDDFEINVEAVNRWVEIPEKFQCEAPFGLEMLLAYATPGKFKPIGKTEVSNGITFILDDLQTVVESSVDASVSKCIIPITTQAKRMQ